MRNRIKTDEVKPISSSKFGCCKFSKGEKNKKTGLPKIENEAKLRQFVEFV